MIGHVIPNLNTTVKIRPRYDNRASKSKASCFMHYTNKLVAVFSLCLITTAGTSRAQDLPSRQPGSSADLEGFRALEPAERLKAIEKLSPTKSPFAPVSKGDLITAIVERGAIEPAKCVDVICKVKATG